MAKGHRSQIKRERNANKDTRPSAKLSYARVSVQKACFVLDAIRGKDVQTALGILTYNPRYASSLIKKLLESAIANAENNNGMNAENLYIAEAYANKDTRPSAKLSYARVSVQKACFVLDAIRGKDVQTALGILTYNPRYASSLIKKLLESAIANAENNNGMNVENLYIEECYANKGPTMKRIRPRAQGRAYRIEKRMSHITLVLNER